MNTYDGNIYLEYENKYYLVGRPNDNKIHDEYILFESDGFKLNGLKSQTFINIWMKKDSPTDKIFLKLYKNEISNRNNKKWKQEHLYFHRWAKLYVAKKYSFSKSDWNEDRYRGIGLRKLNFYRILVQEHRLSY